MPDWPVDHPRDISQEGDGSERRRCSLAGVETPEARGGGGP